MMSLVFGLQLMGKSTFAILRKQDCKKNHWLGGLFISLLALSHVSLAADSLLSQRIKDELATSEKPFVITPHKVNYLLPVTYNSSPNITPFLEEISDTSDEIDPDSVIDRFEAKFQISFKFPIAYNIFGDNGHLYAAYTNQSHWQVYNKDISSPFRETNHEPEMFLLFNNDWEIAGLTNSLWSVGVVHQSNGQGPQRSRSWNRIYGTMVFDRGPLALSAKVWWRISEDAKEYENDPQGDDNPDLKDYMGNFELLAAYGYEEHRFTMMLRNNLKSSNKGAVEATWSYPIVGNLRVYAQYFNGYGESLIDYDASVNRFGIGVAINDLL